MEKLILEWQKRQQKYEELADKYKDDAHNNRKFTYKAMATRDCWKELALQLLQTGVRSSDYRVVEYDGFFQIQKKYIKKENIGFLWWKKEIEKIDWKCVDKYGNFIYSINNRFGNINNYHKKIKDFKDLDSALEKIKVMNNGCHYHYC